MGGLVKGLFGGGQSSASTAALAEQQKERELTQIAQARQRQAAADSAAQTSGQLTSMKTVRGQRLLLSKEEGGVSSTLGSA